MYSIQSKLWLVILIISLSSASYAQDFNLKKPSEGKTLIYLTRSSSYGSLINFKFFDGDTFIGKFNGANYITYECDPGEHVIWASSENRDFVSASLLPNKTYILEAKVITGGFKARVELYPVATDDEKMLKRINKLFRKKPELVLDPTEIAEEEKELAFYINNGLEKYDRDKEKGRNITELVAEMFH